MGSLVLVGLGSVALCGGMAYVLDKVAENAFRLPDRTLHSPVEGSNSGAS